MPRDIKEGDKVVSGSLNLTGVITVKTQSVYSESTVAKILDLVENSSSEKSLRLKTLLPALQSITPPRWL